MKHEMWMIALKSTVINTDQKNAEDFGLNLIFYIKFCIFNWTFPQFPIEC